MSTITKILFRRGLDSSRKLVTLQQGEPGYSLDTKRLFVGDGITPGGTPAGIVNYGTIAALSGSYIYSSVQTNLTPTAFITLSTANVGDIVYDQTTTSVYSVSSITNNGVTNFVVLSNLVHFYSTTNYNTNQFYYNGSQLTIQNGQNGQGYGVGINELNSSVTAGSPTLSGGSGGVLGVKVGGIGNAFITPGSNNSVKITNSTGSVADVIINQNQFLGQTNASGSTLGAVNIKATGGITLNATTDTLTFNTPVGIPQSGGFLTGVLSALNVYSGKFITDVAPVGSNDVVNLNYINSNFNCITPALLSKYLPLTGGTMSGSLSTTSYVAAGNGFYSTNNYTGSYANGIIVDYVTGNGRISVGAADAITLYNGGPASTALLTLAAGGNVGIGTNSPNAALSFGTKFVSGPSQANVVRLYDNGSNSYGFGVSPNTLNIVSPANTLFTNNSLSAIYIASTGNVGVGTTVPSYVLDVASTSGVVRFTKTGGSSSYIVNGATSSAFSYDAAGNNAWSVDANTVGAFTNGTRRLTIDSSGNVYTNGGTLSASRLYAISGAPISNSELTRKDYVDSILPAGTVAYYAATTPPTGWLKANGAILPRAYPYDKLFAAIGLTWTKTGDGPTNFRLPDLRGQFIRGWNDGISNGNPANANPTTTVDAGRVFGDTQADAFKSHTHNSSFNVIGHKNGFITNANYFNQGLINTDYGAGSSPYESTSGSTGDIETRPTNVSLLACIKY
jgi:microcystin-dependent protein